jgi:hypothetical protein
VAEDLDPTGVEREQRADQADERRLASAVGAEDPVDLAARDAQRDVVDGEHRLLLAADDEPLGRMLDEEGRDGAHRTSAVDRLGRPAIGDRVHGKERGVGRRRAGVRCDGHGSCSLLDGDVVTDMGPR